MKRILAILVVGVFACIGTHAAQQPLPADSIRVYYHVGYRTLDMSYCENRAELDRLAAVLQDALAKGKLEKVVIRSYASPIGTNKANERLTVARAEVLKDSIRKYADLPESQIELRSEGIAWPMLHEMVAASQMPARDEVLRIIEETPVFVFNAAGKIVDGRKKQLMDLEGGVPYKYMEREFFPDMQSSIGVAVYYRAEEEPEPEVTETAADTVPAPEPVPQDTVPAATPVEPAPAAEVLPAKEEAGFRPLIAVKTNLLYWATLMADFKGYTFVPNLELEWFFADRWSLAGAGNYAKWGYGDDKFFGISAWSLEPRWWLDDSGNYRWLYIGAYGEAGDYDVQNDRIDSYGNTGKQWSVGLSAGVAIPFSRHWGAEVGLRAGYRRSTVNAYSYEAPDYFRDSRTHDNHWGVTDIKVSIYYRFGKGSSK